MLLCCLKILAAKTHWIIKTARLNQPISCENVLTSKFKSKGELLWGSYYDFISKENESLWIHSKLKKKSGLIEKDP